MSCCIMNITEIINTLESLKEVIKTKYKAEIVGLFGSYVRGEQNKNSDIDILVKFDEDATLLDFMGLSNFLEDELGIRVDIVSQDAIKSEIRDSIMDEVIYI